MTSENGLEMDLVVLVNMAVTINVPAGAPGTGVGSKFVSIPVRSTRTLTTE